MRILLTGLLILGSIISYKAYGNDSPLCYKKLKNLNYAHDLELMKEGRFNRNRIKFNERFKVAVLHLGSMDIEDERISSNCELSTNLYSDFKWNTFFKSKRYAYITEEENYILGHINYHKAADRITVTAYRGRFTKQYVRLSCTGIDLNSTVTEFENAFGNIFYLD